MYLFAFAHFSHLIGKNTIFYLVHKFKEKIVILIIFLVIS